MGIYIRHSKRKKGRYDVWNTVVDRWTQRNATRDEVIEGAGISAREGAEYLMAQRLDDLDEKGSDPYWRGKPPV